MSLPENMLWQRMRDSQLGLKFRRQHPIGPYVADFYCAVARLVVEIDGEAHSRDARVKADFARDRFMSERGLEVLRIPAIDVLKNADAVAEAIAAKLANPHHHPSDGPPLRAGEDIR